MVPSLLKKNLEEWLLVAWLGPISGTGGDWVVALQAPTWNRWPGQKLYPKKKKKRESMVFVPKERSLECWVYKTINTVKFRSITLLISSRSYRKCDWEKWSYWLICDCQNFVPLLMSVAKIFPVTIKLCLILPEGIS